MLHSQHLNFILVSLVLAEYTRKQILLHCMSQWLLWLVSSLFSCLVDGASLPCVKVKTLHGEGPSSVPLSLWAEISSFSDECALKSNPNTSSTSQSVMFYPYCNTANYTSSQFSTQQTQHLWLWSWFKPLHCLACRMLLLWKGTDWTVQLKINISINLQFKQSQRNPYSRMKDICLWSHITLTRGIKVCTHSFPLSLMAYELSCHNT